MRTPAYRPRRPRGAATDESTPVGINIAVGAVTLGVVVLVAVNLPPSAADLRFPLVAVVVGGFAAVSADQVALAGVLVLAALATNGFLENRFGDLSWHSSLDGSRLIVLAFAAVAGLLVGDGYRQVREWRRRWRTAEEMRQMTAGIDEGEEGRDGRPGIRAVDSGDVRHSGVGREGG